jgi:hypothetical protein
MNWWFAEIRSWFLSLVWYLGIKFVLDLFRIFVRHVCATSDFFSEGDELRGRCRSEEEDVVREKLSARAVARPHDRTRRDLSSLGKP